MLHRMAPAEAIWPMARIRFIVAVQLLICPRAIHRPGRTAPRRRRPTRSLQPIVHACGPGRLLRLAHADRSASQSLDPSARNALILMAMTCGPCGLQASSRDDAGTSNGPGGMQCVRPHAVALRFARRDQLAGGSASSSAPVPGAQKNPNRERLGFCYRWRMVDHVPTGLLSL